MSVEFICSTCNHQGDAQSVACGHWSYCPNYANARTDGTLPDPPPRIGGGPS